MVKLSEILLAGALTLAIPLSDSYAAISQTTKRATPQRRKAGESFPPLPLPATPLRRTEKKRQPKPPMLIGEITLVPIKGEKKFEKFEEPRNLQSYMRAVNSSLQTRFASGKTTFNLFSYSPVELPILYFTGTKPFEIKPKIRNNLRNYLINGGSIIFDAAENSNDFRKSALREMALLFPNKKIRKLPQDHPIFYCFNKLQEVNYVKDKEVTLAIPELYGINLGCRTAVIFTPVDLACDWNGPTKGNYLQIQTSDARKLSVNMANYLLAESEYGRTWPIKSAYSKVDSRDAFTIPRIIHEGEWDAQAGIQELLRHTYMNSTLPVSFKDKTLGLADKEIFEYPLVYMSGLSQFELAPSEILNAQRFFDNGGGMFADSTAGRAEFDHSFRKFIKQVFPNSKLQQLPSDHPLFSSFHKIDSVEYNRLFAEIFKIDKSPPSLEAIIHKGELKVIYSQLDMGTKFSQNKPTYELGLKRQDSLDLGLNIIMYTMTH